MHQCKVDVDMLNTVKSVLALCQMCKGKTQLRSQDVVVQNMIRLI